MAEFAYADNGPVQDITLNGVTIGGQANQSLAMAYTYDKVRNVDTLTTTDGLFDYDYDEFDRLTQANYPALPSLPGFEAFGYDNAGNREDPTDATLYDYDSNNRILSSPVAASYRFDAAGNLIERGTNETFQYDHENRLLRYENTATSTVAQYLYDSFGRRIRKTVNGVATWFVWDGTDLIAEYNSAGTRVQHYRYTDNAYAPLQIADQNGTYNVHVDHLGAPRWLTDSTGQVVWKAIYQAYGEVAVDNDPDGNGVTVTFNYRFPGQWVDIESGLYYNFFRYYDPKTGRYVTADPIGQISNANVYSYVDGNPTNYIDPQGLFLINPVTVKLAAEALINLIGILVVVDAANDINKNPAAEEQTGSAKVEKARERKEYSRICKSAIPPTGDPCTDAKNNLERLRKCLLLRQNFSRKWYNDGDIGHLTPIQNTNKAITRLENWIRDNCGEECE